MDLEWRSHEELPLTFKCRYLRPAQYLAAHEQIAASKAAELEARRAKRGRRGGGAGSQVGVGRCKGGLAGRTAQGLSQLLLPAVEPHSILLHIIAAGPSRLSDDAEAGEAELSVLTDAGSRAERPHRRPLAAPPAGEWRRRW